MAQSAAVPAGFVPDGFEPDANSTIQLPTDGLLTPGTIKNLYDRPVLKNADGSVSTTSSSSWNFNGKEVLLPTVVDGKRLTTQEAQDRYRKTGEHLGIFDTPAHADAYAQALHSKQEQVMQRGGTETSDPKDAFWNSIKTQSRQLVKGAVNTLPAIGGIVGGALSTPESVGVATIPGIAVGTGVGRGARDLLAEWLQLDPPSSPLKKAATIALDTATAAAAAKILPVVVDAAQNPKAVFGEAVSRWIHPIRTIDEFATALQQAKTAKITPMASMPQEVAGLEAHLPNTSGYGGPGSAGLNRGPLPTSSLADVDRYAPSQSGYVAGDAPPPQGSLPTSPAVDLDRYAPSGSGYVAGEAANTTSQATSGLSIPQATWAPNSELLADGSRPIIGTGLKVGDVVNVINRQGSPSLQTVDKILRTKDGVVLAAVKK